MKLPFPRYGELLARAGEAARDAGIKAWVVGGCVRDWRLGKDTKDLDIISESDCAPLADFFVKSHGAAAEKFGRFGTYRVQFPDGLAIDLARTRKEIYTRPAALPDVSPAPIEEDLYRRDFTVNTAAASILPENFGELYDPFNAFADIEKGVLRVLHEKSFSDDPTRLYRACRFGGRFGWLPDEKTTALILSAAENNYPALLSRERLRRELFCILSEKNPKAAFALIARWKLDAFIHKNLRWHDGMAQAQSLTARLGLTAFAAGQWQDFLASLNLERKTAVELRIPLSALQNGLSPEHEPTPAQAEILLLAAPERTAAARARRIVTAGVLREAGFTEPKDFSALCERAAAAQWNGQFADRASALLWLKKLPARQMPRGL